MGLSIFCKSSPLLLTLQTGTLRMEPPEIAAFARNFAVMVRISGPDPKGLKFRRHAFHHHESGKTTLSASGLLLSDTLLELPIRELAALHRFSSLEISALIVTTGSLVEPFLPSDYRSNRLDSGKSVKLIPGAQIDVLTEIDEKENRRDKFKDPRLVPAEFLALVNVPTASAAVQSLVEARHGSKEHSSWEAGWSLYLLNDNNNLPNINPIGKEFAVDDLHNPSIMAASTTRIAILGISSENYKYLPHINASLPSKKGELLLVMGSPFGILSPFHFFNSISVGSVANCCPPDSVESSILMADIRCLPGMEGGPVFGKDAGLVGILIRPLRQRAGGTEVQLVVTWHAIAKALRSRLFNDHKSIKNSIDKFPSLSQFKKAIPSIVLVSMREGSWASGVILNKNGLILTNAHVLDPWRLSRNLNGIDKTSSATPSIFAGKPVHFQESNYERKSFTVGSSNNVYKGIRVRLHHVEPPIWCNATTVYVSKGPLDVALLQLETVPACLCPIVSEFTCPPRGSNIYVIGHGLFGPNTGLRPSICSGVVSKLVEIQRPVYMHELGLMEAEGPLAAVLVTTASVHPGLSGGAVVNSKGHMIGLITSNAKHSSGTFIPHLNFSIPSAALKPIFKFSDTREKSFLSAMDKPDESLSSVWTLKPLQEHFEQSQQLPNVQNSLLQKEGKGSRFAKFLAERQGEISAKLNNTAVVSREKFPSKL